MKTKTFSISSWQVDTLKELSKCGVNSSQLVRLGLHYILNKLIIEKESILQIILEIEALPVPKGLIEFSIPAEELRYIKNI